MYKHSCRTCGSKNLKPVVSFGDSPLANNLLNSMEEFTEVFPLEVEYCENCHNVQLNYVVPAEKLFKHYLYVSSTTKSMRDHFENASSHYTSMFGLNKNSFVIDIGSNDGVALKPLKKKNVKVLGIEPATNIAKIATDNGIETINDFFTDDIADEILERGKADIITASNVFAHADGIEEIVKTSFKTLKDDGSFIVEVQYILDTINDLTFDNVYHEHVTYWSVSSLNNFFKKLGFKLYRVEHIDTHGGSIRAFVCKDDREIQSSVTEFLNNEIENGLTEYNTYLEFGNRIQTAKKNVLNNIRKLKQAGISIVGYGSPAKATTALNYFGITNKQIDYIIEDNELKHNKVVPGVYIPIYSKEKAELNLPDIILVLAWNFFEEVKENNKKLIDLGVRFVNIKELQNENWN
jgi:2-polyprenyl-3-methyl-5-hydroxy-6-metoxy-1,4-benzoquinol methylase